ncbi:hypothetical protein QTO34_008195 [Cnephaeus nilssonii]|uniref:MCM C-terminal AAA(+) ATPase domain-containing protein n=1 Tax=Cnephaeus nilssonii TaxID=3371016 RepID=A0AA40IA84_CNENI|nr:hypothetical protein QTO34_008195 [Eptesicus nilssonii]
MRNLNLEVIDQLITISGIKWTWLSHGSCLCECCCTTYNMAQTYSCFVIPGSTWRQSELLRASIELLLLRQSQAFKNMKIYKRESCFSFSRKQGNILVTQRGEDFVLTSISWYAVTLGPASLSCPSICTILLPWDQDTSEKCSSAVDLSIYVENDSQEEAAGPEIGVFVLNDSGICSIDKFEKRKFEACGRHLAHCLVTVLQGKEQVEEAFMDMAVLGTAWLTRTARPWAMPPLSQEASSSHGSLCAHPQ